MDEPLNSSPGVGHDAGAMTRSPNSDDGRFLNAIEGLVRVLAHRTDDCARLTPQDLERLLVLAKKGLGT